ncbi:hypothetical protein QZH41_004961 [Actinostola sp. cb2023]|nr:hypothetical protein QZH41_004961 [Actinostola sp. cb2023]
MFFSSLCVSEYKAVVMGLNVKSARCAAQSTFFFGALFLFGSALYFGLRIGEIYQSKNIDIFSLHAWMNYWYFGYPVLVALWICTFFLFSLALVGFQGYFLHDFTAYIKISRSNLDSGLCKLGLNKKIATNCYLRVIAEGSLMSLAVLTLVLACWCAVCCCFSFCGGSSVEPEESSEEEQVPPPPPPPPPPQPYPSQSMPMQNVMGPKMPNSNLPVMACIAAPMATSMQAMPNHVIPMTPYSSGMYPSIPVGYPSAVPMPYSSGYIPGIPGGLPPTVTINVNSNPQDTENQAQ